jgi:hypothetical protein
MPLARDQSVCLLHLRAARLRSGASGGHIQVDFSGMVGKLFEVDF